MGGACGCGPARGLCLDQVTDVRPGSGARPNCVQARGQAHGEIAIDTASCSAYPWMACSPELRSVMGHGLVSPLPCLGACSGGSGTVLWLNAWFPLTPPLLPSCPCGALRLPHIGRRRTPAAGALSQLDHGRCHALRPLCLACTPAARSSSQALRCAAKLCVRHTGDFSHVITARLPQFRLHMHTPGPTLARRDAPRPRRLATLL